METEKFNVVREVEHCARRLTVGVSPENTGRLRLAGASDSDKENVLGALDKDPA